MIKKLRFYLLLLCACTQLQTHASDNSKEIEVRISPFIKIFEKPKVTVYLFKKELHELLQMPAEERARLTEIITPNIEAIPMIGTFKTTLSVDCDYKSLCLEITGKLTRDIDRYAQETHTLRSAIYSLTPETKNIGVSLAAFLPNSIDLIGH
jgi:hypothetical protein